MSRTPTRCYLEFYETDELGGQIDNWCGPTTQCLMAMARSAGFPRVELKYVDSRRGGLVAHRRWEPVEPGSGTAPPSSVPPSTTAITTPSFSRAKTNTCASRFSRRRTDEGRRAGRSR